MKKVEKFAFLMQVEIISRIDASLVSALEYRNKIEKKLVWIKCNNFMYGFFIRSNWVIEGSWSIPKMFKS